MSFIYKNKSEHEIRPTYTLGISVEKKLILNSTFP